MQLEIDIKNRQGLIQLAKDASTDEVTVTPEAYLAARINEILDSYDAALIQRIKQENDPFFELAAKLPLEDQDAIRSAVMAKAEERGLVPAE